MTKDELDQLLSRMSEQILKWEEDEPREDWWRYQRDYALAYEVLVKERWNV